MGVPSQSTATIFTTRLSPAVTMAAAAACSAQKPMEQEISSKAIGEMVMDELKNLDEVAYVRYASVYRSFKDISSFMAELQRMMDGKK